MKTGAGKGASTNDDLYLYLYGDRCSHIGTFLDHPNCNDFELGQTDSFTFGKRSVGNVRHSVFMQFFCAETWVHDESQLGEGGGRGGCRLMWSRTGKLEPIIYFNVSLNVRDKVTRLSTDHNFIWSWGRGGRGGLYTCRYTVTTGMTPALRWAAMRAILIFR